MPLSRLILPILAAIALALVSTAAFAHHAFEAEFDTAASVTLKGKIAALELTNPHSTIVLTVAEPGKPPQDWRILSGTPQNLKHRGVCRSTLKPGMDVTISAYLAKDKSCLTPVGEGHPVCQVAGKFLTFPATQSLVDIYSSGSFSVFSPEQTLCQAQAGE